MLAPIPNKILTTAIVASAALLIAAAPPNAMGPDESALSACIPSAPENTSVEPLDAPQQALVNHLARRYAIASDATERMVAAAYSAAQEVGLDPLLVLAVISIESRFNPIAESNIHVGARILQEYVYRTRTLEAGLQYYNGAWRDNSAQYAQRVLAERARLVEVLRSI
jgi:hypothetical protein